MKLNDFKLVKPGGPPVPKCVFYDRASLKASLLMLLTFKNKINYNMKISWKF